jgi:hypothetical protein
VGGFFLRDGHVRELCRRDERGVSARAEQPPSGLPCLACELDGLVCAMFCGDSKPVVPAAFLHSWWRHAPEHLRGQGQHDAHEFFLGLVSAAHADLARGDGRDGDGRRDQTPGLDKGLDSGPESGRVCRESATRGDENVSDENKKNPSPATTTSRRARVRCTARSLGRSARTWRAARAATSAQKQTRPWACRWTSRRTG